MANIESNTLLEKLTEINLIKNELRQTIIDIGGGSYINEQTPFASFPSALTSTFSDIKSMGILLENIVTGEDTEELINKDIIKYLDLITYVASIKESKLTLVNNLRTMGVMASQDESLDSLINKILRIGE